MTTARISITIPRLTPYPVTVGAFAFTRHSPPMCSILHRDCCGEKARRWRFRSGSDGSVRPLNSRRTAVLCRGNKKSEFTRGGFNSDRVVDHVGKQGEKAPGGAFSVPRLKNALSIVRGKAHARDDLPFFTVGEPRGRYRGV